MKIKRLLIVIGTRPEAIKLAPVIKKVREKAAGSIEAKILVTAQHREILDHTLAVFGITPDYDLNLMTEGQSISAVCAGVMSGMEPILDKEGHLARSV